MLASAALFLSLLGPLPDRPEAYLDVQKLAEGVYADIRKEPPGLAVDCNVLFIINDSDVVLVDTNIGPESAKATLAALRKLTNKPISSIVATHYHDDHMGGTATFLADSPKAELVAHESSPAAIETLLKPARAGMIEVAPQMSTLLKNLMSQGKSFGGWPITEEEKTSYQNDIRIAERYAKEMKEIPLPKPTRLVKDRQFLRRGARDIHVLHLGHGHTPSDLVVYLPAKRIVAAGDLIVYPVPLVGGPQSSIQSWPQALGKLKDLKFDKLVPGHGPVLTDSFYLSKMQGFFTEAFQLVKAAVDRGQTLPRIQQSMDFSANEKSFCGESKLRKVLWDNYVKTPTIAAAYREIAAKSEPR